MEWKITLLAVGLWALRAACLYFAIHDTLGLLARFPRPSGKEIAATEIKGRKPQRRAAAWWVGFFAVMGWLF